MCCKEFRNNRLKNYGLCPSHYLSAPGLTWDKMIETTKIELELIPDLEFVGSNPTRDNFLYGIAKP